MNSIILQVHCNTILTLEIYWDFHIFDTMYIGIRGGWPVAYRETEKIKTQLLLNEEKRKIVFHTVICSEKKH